MARFILDFRKDPVFRSEPASLPLISVTKPPNYPYAVQNRGP